MTLLMEHFSFPASRLQKSTLRRYSAHTRIILQGKSEVNDPNCRPPTCFVRSTCGSIKAGLAPNQTDERVKFCLFKKEKDEEGNVVSREMNSWQTTTC